MSASDELNLTGLAEHFVRGEIRKVVFSSEDGSFAVVSVVDSKGNESVLTGPMHSPLEGQFIESSGVWENHKEYGRRLRVKSYRYVLPASAEGIRRYLASGLIPGIGAKYAEKIVDHFGEKTLETLQRFSSRLTQVEGIGKKRAKQIREAWDAHANRNSIYIYLQGLGISPAYCAKLLKRYGDDAAAIVKSNPYRLADEVHGIGFLMADRIAAKLGIEPNDIERLAAGARYVMGEVTGDGHCCLPESKFLEHTANLLKVSLDQASDGMNYAIQKKLLVAEQALLAKGGEKMIYSRPLFLAEIRLPKIIQSLASSQVHTGLRMEKIPIRPKLNLSPEQLHAVKVSATAPLSIITGGPGVGKTTVVSEIVRRANAAKLKISLAAPTGRAAQRLSESTNSSAATIHRLLRWEPESHSFSHNQDNLLKCDLLIVDEASMLDIQLALSLFQAVRPGATVILVGDGDQLPSVGPGKVLDCLIHSGIFEVTALTKIFRQGPGSSIIVNAHQVNNGLMPNLQPPPRGQISDFYWIEQDDPEMVLEKIMTMLCERIPQRFGFDPIREIQILTPMNRGSCGTLNMNHLLQEKLVPGPRPQFKIGERTFKSGDKVIQTVNNYDKNVFNGDMGRISNIDTNKKTFTIFFESRPVEYDFTDAEQINLAYAITIHKSQGSEFPAVIVPLLNQHYMMLQRNLLYTAMTRASRLLVLIGSRKAVSMAVRNTRLRPRCTLLLERLTGKIK
jgi:exodeoxyribonuclease V alpha subunit